jgi:hypothetical protein
MGDNFLKQQVRNFKKGRDKALELLSSPSLFSLPEEFHRLYPAFDAAGQTINESDVLIAIPSKTIDKIDLIRGTYQVGFVEGDPAILLMELMGKVGLLVQVDSKDHLSGVSQIRIIDRGESP